MKVLAVGQYDGTFKNKDGKEIKYSKVMLTVSQNGYYPKLLAVDIPVYMDTGGKILGREIEIEYKNEYGKLKPSNIKVLD